MTPISPRNAPRTSPVPPRPLARPMTEPATPKMRTQQMSAKRMTPTTCQLPVGTKWTAGYRNLAQMGQKMDTWLYCHRCRTRIDPAF
jgi:hypothetical protein